MSERVKSIYEELFQKESAAFNPKQIPQIKKLLQKYIGSTYEAEKAYSNLEKNPGIIRKMLGSVGKPPDVDVQTVVGKHLGRQVRNLDRTLESLTPKHLKARIKDLEAMSGIREPKTPHLVAAGLGGSLLGAGAGHLITGKAYEKKLEKAEMDKMRAAAEALGIGMALPQMMASGYGPMDMLDSIAYPRG